MKLGLLKVDVLMSVMLIQSVMITGATKNTSTSTAAGSRNSKAVEEARSRRANDGNAGSSQTPAGECSLRQRATQRETADTPRNQTAEMARHIDVLDHEAEHHIQAHQGNGNVAQPSQRVHRDGLRVTDQEADERTVYAEHSA